MHKAKVLSLSGYLYKRYVLVPPPYLRQFIFLWQQSFTLCPKGHHPSNLPCNIPSGQTRLCNTAQNGCDQKAVHSRNMGAGRQGRDFVWWLHWRYPSRKKTKKHLGMLFLLHEVISTPPPADCPSPPHKAEIPMAMKGKVCKPFFIILFPWRVLLI